MTHEDHSKPKPRASSRVAAAWVAALAAVLAVAAIILFGMVDERGPQIVGHPPETMPPAAGAGPVTPKP